MGGITRVAFKREHAQLSGSSRAIWAVHQHRYHWVKADVTVIQDELHNLEVL
jgi:hypothetical protein